MPTAATRRGPVAWGAALALGGVLLLGGCPSCDTGTPDPRPNQPNLRWCPGSPGCLSEASTPLLAGAAKRDVTPRGFEIPNPRSLSSTACDPAVAQRLAGLSRCGSLRWPRDDCGRDGLCPGDVGYPGPDADGTEGDHQADFFLDCGGDRICPGNEPERDDPATPGVDEAHDGLDNDGDGAVDDGPYTGADADGSENDGVFQAAWLAGLGPERPALGVHDPLEVRCLALRTAQTTVALCTLDALGMFPDDVERVRALVQQRFPLLDLDYLAVSSTGTHAGVDLLGDWGSVHPSPTTGRLTGHNATVVEEVAVTVAEAVQSLVPVELSMRAVATGREGLVEDLREPRVYDDTMTIVEARRPVTGTPVFTALSWADTADLAGPSNSLISADFPGALREAVESGLPAAGTHPAHAGRGGMALFFNGALGGRISSSGVDLTDRRDQVLRSTEPSFARVKALGENLAERALTALESPEGAVTLTETAMVLKAEQVLVPLDNPQWRERFLARLYDRTLVDPGTGTQVATLSGWDGGVGLRTEVFTLSVGTWRVVGLPGLPFPESAVGGLDGGHSLGEPLVDPDHCPSQASCTASAGDCPTGKPDGGWADCQCEACRLCVPPDLTAAPAGPALKTRVGGRFPMVLALSNDALGPLVPAYDWRLSEHAPYTCAALDHPDELEAPGPVLPRLLEALDKLFSFRL